MRTSTTLSPRDRRPRRVPRRGWLLGLIGVVAAGSGWLIGRWTRAALAGGPEDHGAESALPNELPEWQRQQIVRARSFARGPIDVLYENRLVVMVSLNRAPFDPDLWHGVYRLAEHVVWTDAPERERVAGQVLDYVERLSPVGVDFAGLVPALQRIAKR